MTSRVSDEALITPNFAYWEFKCHCEGLFCDGYPEFIEQVEATAVHLQGLRDARSENAGREMPIVIERGFSCPEYNATVIGASGISHHMYDMWPLLGEGGVDAYHRWYEHDTRLSHAAWLKETLAALAQEAYELGWRGIKIYRGHVHLDRRMVPWLRNFEPKEHIPIER